MRVAIYFTPRSDSQLDIAARQWFGTEKLVGIPKDAFQRLLKVPVKYGFHGTLKPPFFLEAGYSLDDVERELCLFAAENRAFMLPPLEVTTIDSFFCLKSVEESEELKNLASSVVEHFDYFRKPATETELERRRQSSLSSRQDQLLLKWGYPYVLSEFTFHLTLTGKMVDENQRSIVRCELEKRFRQFSSSPLSFDALAICIQPGNGAFVEFKKILLKK